MPTFGPFRALRYDRAAGDPSQLICPPYDVIGPADRERLFARHPHNAVRIEFPVLPGDDGGGYARAADTLRAWRAEGVLRLEETPALYVYEERYRLGAGPVRTQRGVFGRLLLEPLGEGIRPHERTLAAPKEDRLRLLRATATDTSPIVLLSPAGAALSASLDAATRAEPDLSATDDAGVTHRLWVVPGDADVAVAMSDAVSAAPLTIADGHHRYETALGFRDERRDGDAPPGEQPEDFVLALVLPVGDGSGPTILPTHRIVHGDAVAATDLVRAVHGRFAVDRRPTAEVVADFALPFPVAGGRVGVITPRHAGEIALDAAARDRLLPAEMPEAVKALDVAVVDAFIRRFLDDHPAAGLSYTHEAREAADAVGSGDVAAAMLLAPTPLASVIAVAAAGAVMPQKSTYFYPKAATGLVMYPLE